MSWLAKRIKATCCQMASLHLGHLNHYGFQEMGNWSSGIPSKISNLSLCESGLIASNHHKIPFSKGLGMNWCA
jgi:hypothetical protein